MSAVPLLRPDCFCIHLEPGEVRTESTRIESAPSATQMTARILNGDSFVRVKELIVTQIRSRPYTEQEIEEFYPPNPPSLREDARRYGRYEWVEEVGRGSGTDALHVGATQTVEIVLEFSATAETPEGIATAQLLIEGGTWTAQQVPVYCIVGRPVAAPALESDALSRAQAPGEATTQPVMITHTPTASQFVACVINGNGVIRLKQMIALQTIRREATEEELAEATPAMREILRREGYKEDRETTRSTDATLDVARGQKVQFDVEFSAPAQRFPNITRAVLVIDAPRWQQTQVPLNLIIGRFSVTLSTDNVAVNQGGTAKLRVTLVSHAGPGGEVHLAVAYNTVTVLPSKVDIDPGSTTVRDLTFSAAQDAPIGSFNATFVARVEQQAQHLPIRLTVVPASVHVQAFPVVVTQGDAATFEIHVISKGGQKYITLSPGFLPPGVRVEPASFLVGPAAVTHIQRVQMFVDIDAPTTEGAWTPIHWSAGDGVHAGILNVPLTITLKPDSRTFRRDITTPAGTALGGFAELVVHSNGNYTFRGHMHGSGFDSYAFCVNYFLRSPDSELSLADVFSSRVGGSLGGGPRDRDWNRDGHSDLIRVYWPKIKSGDAEFGFSYENTGVLGELDDFAGTILKFLVIRVLAGPVVAAVLILGRELADAADLPVTSPNGPEGMVILGGVVLLFGPLAVIPAYLAGVAVAQLDNVLSREMHESEKAEARRVFGDTLPFDRIRIVNLIKRNPERWFAMLNEVDDKILICVGDDFHREILGNRDFIHELTHAWQYEYRAFSLADLWKATVEKPLMSYDDWYDREYRVPYDGRPWRDFTVEGQAVAVETWFSLNKSDLDSEAARKDPLFPYILNNIRMKAP